MFYFNLNLNLKYKINDEENEISQLNEAIHNISIITFLSIPTLSNLTHTSHFYELSQDYDGREMMSLEQHLIYFKNDFESIVVDVNMCLNKEINYNTQWTEGHGLNKYFSLQYKEDQAIVALVEEFGVMDWTNISEKLKEKYNINERTGKQCRERWYNHLNPEVNKKPWTDEEEKLLFEIHRKSGNKWKLMSRYFEGRESFIEIRTDNDIKNHFYSTLRRSLRRLNKFIGEKNSTTQMREIKPSVLSTIMNYIYEQENNIESNIVNSLKGNVFVNNKDLPYLIFEFSNYKPVKSKVKIEEDEEIKSKINFIFTLITKAKEFFNKIYSTTYQVLKQNSRMVKNNKKCNNNDNEINMNKKNMIKNDGTNNNVNNCQNNNSEEEIPTHVQISPEEKYTSTNNNNNNKHTTTTTTNNYYQHTISPTKEEEKLIEQQQLDFIKYLPKKSNSHNFSIELSPPKKMKEKTVKIIKRQFEYSEIKMENEEQERERLIDVNKDIHTELIGEDMNIQHHADFLIKRDFESDYNMSNTKRESIQNLEELTYQRTRRISLEAYEDFMEDEEIGEVEQPSEVGFYCPGSLDDLVVVGKQVVIHEIVGNTNEVKMEQHSDHSNIDELIEMNYSH